MSVRVVAGANVVGSLRSRAVFGGNIVVSSVVVGACVVVGAGFEMTVGVVVGEGILVRDNVVVGVRASWLVSPLWA